MKKLIQYLIIFFLLSLAQFSHAQNPNSVWCFGDSALIDFSDINNPVNEYSAVRSRGSCASIADENGDLLFYAQPYYPFQQIINLNKLTLVYNKNHQLMENGDSIVGEGWLNELIIINNPANINEFYLFSLGVASFTPEGVYYTIIDISKNNGLGEVISKNNQLTNWKAIDCISAVKHANGKDWWLVTRRWDFILSYDVFYFWLINENGIQGPFTQQIGLATWSGFTRIVFSPDGSKLAMIHFPGVFQIFDFDRCSGLLSNPVTIDVDNPDDNYWSAEFSASGKYLYVISHLTVFPNYINKLYQYDLEAPDIAASRVTIITYQNNTPLPILFGSLRRAPDNKIYLATRYEYGFDMPFPDSIYNIYNMNLSVINNPDSPGLACDFNLFSFYLGGKRTYAGLPNNPDYGLGPDVAQPANAGNDTSICVNGLVKLGIPANNVSTYSWYPPDGLDDANIAQPTATPTQDTWYYLTVTDTTKSAGCNESRDSVFVKVINCDTIDPNPKLIIPNVVSPNNDDKNDYFTIKNLPSNSSLTIFNRWGNEIFKSEDYKNDWPVNEISAGVYFYVLKIKSEEEVRKGSVTVVK